MCSHREQARLMRALGAAYADQVDADMPPLERSLLRAHGRAHLLAAEILEGAHAALGDGVIPAGPKPL